MRSISRGCTVQVYLRHGDPHGIRILSRAGWDGYVLALPRADVADARDLEEMNKPATVILLGTAADNQTRVRVGNADPAADHLPMFRADQRWTQLFVLGREHNFSKVLARQTALLMAEAARRTGLAEVVDACPTAPEKAPAGIRTEAESFTREALVLLALCGVSVFGTAATAASSSALTTPADSTQKTGARTPSAITPPKPARAVHTRPPATSQPVGKAHYDEDMRLLLDRGLLRPGQQLTFEQPRKGTRYTAFVEEDGGLRVQNTRYPSPTSAAVAAAGGSHNGWICWRTAEGRLLDDLRRQVRGRKG